MANADAERKPQFECTFLQGQHDLWVSQRGKLDRQILAGGAFIAYRTRDNGNVAGLRAGLYATGGANSNKRIGTDLDQFLDCDGCRGTADSGGGDGDLFTAQIARNGGEFPVLSDELWFVEKLSNSGTARWITRQQHVTANIAVI